MVSESSGICSWPSRARDKSRHEPDLGAVVVGNRRGHRRLGTGHLLVFEYS